MHFLEINSKSGLYPLYVAYNIYRSRVEAAKAKYGEVSHGFAMNLWDATIEENILVVCKTSMAKGITKRTLAGRDGLPDKSVILVTANFKTHEKCNVRNLAKFLNQVAPRYGYEFLAVENNEVLNGHLNLTEVPIKYSNCYFASFGEELAETL